MQWLSHAGFPATLLLVLGAPCATGSTQTFGALPDHLRVQRTTFDQISSMLLGAEFYVSSPVQDTRRRHVELRGYPLERQTFRFPQPPRLSALLRLTRSAGTYKHTFVSLYPLHRIDIDA